jgi:hypothetical protein
MNNQLNFLNIFLLFNISILLFSCKNDKITGDVEKPVTCAYSSGTLLVKSWVNNDIQTDSYNVKGVLESTTINTIGGNLKINSDQTYTLSSSGESKTGKWAVNEKCQLIFDAGTAAEKIYELLNVSANEFSFRMKDGNKAYTYHYKILDCAYQTLVTKKWLNTMIRTDIYSTVNPNTRLSSVKTYPVGFFNLQANGNYEVLSENIPQTGKWQINTANCNLVLDGTTAQERSFEIVKSTNDSLIIKRKSGSTIYTQYYKAYECPSTALLVNQWDNIATNYNYFNITGDAIIYSDTQYPIGYLIMKTDQNYNVLSNGVPQTGKWTLTTGCKLVLDQGTAGERLFDILKVNKDSLTLWRNDNINRVALTQTYKKH